MVILRMMLLVVALSGLGCAPISEVLRTDLASSQYLDVIERGEEWLNDASLEEQASKEGRVVHRLVAEAHLGLAIAKGRLDAFERFRTRYEKFSAYEDLLTKAYQEEAKVALSRRLGPNPSWADFKWFEGRYGQSDFVGQARARILTAELGRLSVKPTVEGYQTLRDRFADWDEFKQHREGTLKAEAALFKRVYLTPDATLESYRKYALTYSDHMTAELVSEVSKRELAEAMTVDELETWSALETRYPFAWASALNQEARHGVLSVKIQRAMRANTKHAFKELSAEYAKASKDLRTEITNAECTWILGQIRMLTDTRQPIKSQQAIYLMQRMSLSQRCFDMVLTASQGLVESAVGVDLWLNRILRRASASTKSPSRAVMVRSEEAAGFWANAQSSNRAQVIQSAIDWYPELELAAQADKQLVALAKLASQRQSRMTVRVHATQSRRRNRKMSLVSLQDRFHGLVELTKMNLRAFNEGGSETPPHILSVKPSLGNHVWFGGRLSSPEDIESFRTMWLKYKRYYSLYDRSLKTGVVTKRKRRLRWKEFNDLDKLVESLGQATRSVTLGLVSAVSKALTRRSIGTKVVYFGTPESEVTLSDCRQADQLLRQACQEKIMSDIQGKPLPNANQQLGLVSNSMSPDKSLGAQFTQIGITPLPIGTLDGNGTYGARTFEVLHSKMLPSESMHPNFSWSPELVWHWDDTEQSDTDPKADEPTTETVPSKQMSGLNNGTLQVFASKNGEVGVVTSEQTKSKVLYLPGDETRWRLVTTIPEAESRTVLYASIVRAEEMEVVRIVFSDATMDWLSERQIWRKPINIVRHSDFSKSETAPSLPESGEVWGLPNRVGVVLLTDPNGGIWRTYNGGISWRHSEANRRFSQLKGYFRNNPVICAHVSVIGSNVGGVECSFDDGLTWQRLLTGTDTIRLNELDGEMVVQYGAQSLRLAYLIDEGKIRRDLLFVGRDKRLSQTGQWFGKLLKENTSKARDRLLVSRSLAPVDMGPSEGVGPVERALKMKRVSAELFDNRPSDKPKDPHWHYAILGSLNHTSSSD